ncbi:MAG: ABC transporter ATP-binding protein [Spirochaetales bacterium]|nr:ABC transporter ATP-binding protein [Spirochaetales bacterium]
MKSDKYHRILHTLPDNSFKGYWKLSKGNRGTIIAAILCEGVMSVCFTAGFFIVRYFIDQVLLPGKWSFPVLYMAVAYILLNIFSGLAGFIAGRGGAKAAESIVYSIRNSVFDHIQKLSFTYHDRMKTGELIQRSTSDVDAIRLFFAEQVMGLAHIFFLFIINFSAIFYFNWELALLSSIIIPAVLLLSRTFFKKIFNSYGSYQDQDAKVSSVLQENLTGIRVVRAFARAEFEKEKFDKENKEKFRCGKILMYNHALYWPFSHILCGIQSVLGLSIACLMTLHGSITLGTLLAYSTLVNRIIWPMQHMGRLLALLSRSSVSYKRIAEILNEKQEPHLESPAEDGHTIKGKLLFHDVWFSYEKDKPVLKGISLEVFPGQVIALLGEAGSGKTSLVNLLPRFYEYSKGKILLDSKPLSEYPKSYLREIIGLVEQEPFLFSISIKDNIAYGIKREITKEDIENAAKAAAIHESIMEFPEKYDTIIGERGVTLSGGQKQRIAIARALVKDPRILILDDSTSSVDAETEQEIRETLETLMNGRTTFIIAHRIQSLMRADQILVFHKGEIIQRGNHAGLIKEDGFYKKVFELQTSIEAELQEEMNSA